MDAIPELADYIAERGGYAEDILLAKHALPAPRAHENEDRDSSPLKKQQEEHDLDLHPLSSSTSQHEVLKHLKNNVHSYQTHMRFDIQAALEQRYLHSILDDLYVQTLSKL